MCKFDLNAAYRRCHLSGHTASECLTIHDGTLLMALWVAFRGSPCPSLWGYISDTSIMPRTIMIYSMTHHYSLTSLPPCQIPYHSSISTTFSKSTIEWQRDNSIGVVPDIDDNVSQVSRVTPLAIHSIARPFAPSKSIPQKDTISMKKFLVEGSMEEVKHALGLVLNTRSLTIALPTDKHEKWTIGHHITTQQ